MKTTRNVHLRLALFGAAMVSLVGVSVGFADQGNGKGHGNGHGDEVVSQSPQPTPQSPQPAPKPKEEKGESDAGTASLEERHGVAGEITGVQGGVLTIETASGLEVKIKLTADTELRGTGHAEVELADLVVGLKVNVQGEPTEAEGDATLVASKVMVHLARD